MHRLPPLSPLAIVAHMPYNTLHIRIGGHMETASQISEILNSIQKRNNLTDQQLADSAGVSRWTIYRIRRGIIGERLSTNLIGFILREQLKHLGEQAA